MIIKFLKFNAIWDNGWQVLSRGTEVHSELVHQVLILISQNKGTRMADVCDFLRPFLNFSVLHVAFSDSSASSLVRHLISSMASLCCSFPFEAMPVFKLLLGCLRYYPQKTAEVSYVWFCSSCSCICHYFVETSATVAFVSKAYVTSDSLIPHALEIYRILRILLIQWRIWWTHMRWFWSNWLDSDWYVLQT